MDIESLRAMLAQMGQQQQGGPPPSPPSDGLPPDMGMDPDMDGDMDPSMMGMGGSAPPPANGLPMLPDSRPLGTFSPANGMDSDVDGDMDNTMPTDQSFEEIMQRLTANAAGQMPPLR